jgi:hypothetical protein
VAKGEARTGRGRIGEEAQNRRSRIPDGVIAAGPSEVPEDGGNRGDQDGLREGQKR